MEPYKDNVHKGLRRKLRIFLIVSVIILGVSVFHIINDHGSVALSLVGLVIGVAIGIVAARMYKISWDKNAEQVISSFDAVGVVVLVLYIIFEIFRVRIVGQFVDTRSVVSVSFAVLAGIMYGRVVGIKGRIRSIFEKEGVSS